MWRVETRSTERNRRPNSTRSAFIALFIARSIELSQIALRFLKSFVRQSRVDISTESPVHAKRERRGRNFKRSPRRYLRVTILLTREGRKSERNHSCLKKLTYYKPRSAAAAAQSLFPKQFWRYERK